MNKTLKHKLKKCLLENQYVDIALDNLGKVGDFNKLSDLNKLYLLSGSDDYEKLLNINLLNVFICTT